MDRLFRYFHARHHTGVWRTGRSLGRTLYVQTANDPAKEDQFVGIMETKELADLVCDAVNEYRKTQRGGK